MDMDCKKFAKDIRTMDKEMRAWDVYLGLEATIKNMMASLKAVGDLQNSSIRDRHWKQLMDATGVSYEQCFFATSVQGTLWQALQADDGRLRGKL